MAKETKNEGTEVVVEALSKTELFIKQYGKWMAYTLIALILVGVAVFCWYKFAWQPKKAEALEQMYPAEANFRNSEYELALNGDGNVLGFAQIIDEYGSKAGASVYFYAGICEFNLGNYQESLDYLKRYKGGDAILSARAKACMGDAYVGLEDYAKAVSCYEKAAAAADNVFAAGYLLKAGITCEKLGQDQKALGFYKQIKEKYPQSIQGYDIDKYITRIEVK